MTIKTFAIIDSRDISELGKLKASGCVWAIYTALQTFARGTKASCFPSIKTISDTIGGAYSEAGIFKALKWLEDKKFIKRNERKSKQRFVMLRKLARATSTKVEKALCSTKVENKNKKKNTSFFKRGNNKKRFFGFSKKKQELGYGRFQSSQDTSQVMTAEKAFSALIARSEGKDLSVLSKEEYNAIVRGLEPSYQQEADWRLWAYQQWPKIIQNILKRK